MKIQVAIPIAFLMLGAIPTSSALELPTQKPGVWEITMKSASMPGGSRSYRICQDAAFLAAAKASADAHLKNDCSRHDLRKDGDSWIADMECTFSGMHDVSHSVTTIHGDDAYHTEMTSSTGPTGHARRSTTMTIDNKWLGACKPGQKVGVPEVGK